jgi:hypothetical protein
MRLKSLPAAALALALMTTTGGALAQVRTPITEGRGQAGLSPAERDAVVVAVKAAYKANYVFPERIPAILARLDKAEASGRYAVTNPNELAALITGDLREASGDGHAYMQYDPQRYAAATADTPSGGPGATLGDFDAAVARRDNHGLVETRILPGNIRYLKIAGFEWVGDETGQAYDGAMRFLKGGDAVIIDLRGNGGGSAEAVQYAISHFLKAGTLEITFLHAGQEPVQTRVLDNLPAGRMIGKPLYVLIDKGVGSAAESFAYDVQQFKLGTLIGASTAGAANNNDFFPVAPGYMLSVSTGRPVHAVSHANWEGTGVAPDVAIAPVQALDMAQSLALNALSAKHPAPEIQADYDWARVAVEARLHPVMVSDTAAQALAGTYGGKYVITADKDGPWIARPGHPLWAERRRLIPLTADGLFAVEGIDILRVGFKDQALQVWWKDEVRPQVLPRR